ncbi:MAG: FkbM family methyltransferase [Chthoniobacteraceae bacterium]
MNTSEARIAEGKSYDEQGTEVEWLKFLAGYVTSKRFIDAGAEKEADAKGTIRDYFNIFTSMLERGEIQAPVGILKIDTEGNDPGVLQGLGELSAEVILCDYITPSIHKGREVSFPEGLIREARKLGYRNVIAVKRRGGQESAELNPPRFVDGDWGHLIFLNDPVFAAAQHAIRARLQRPQSPCHFPSPVQVHFSPNYGESFTQWLEAQVEGFARLDEKLLLLDVGAYHGDFSKPFLQKEQFAGAFLFEPNPQNAKIVQELICDIPNTAMERLAISNENGTAEFYCDGETATGSLLPYAYPPKGKLHRYQVKKARLDDYLDDRGILDQIGLLKIDTQGHDLDVLKGAVRTLEESAPIVVLEMLFTELYSGQAPAHEIVHWMAGHGYRLAGLFDEHYSAEGWLGWCDGCFVPVSRAAALHEPFQIRTAPAAAVEPLVHTQETAREFRERSGLLEKEIAALNADRAKKEAKIGKLRAEIAALKRNPLRELSRRLRGKN